MSASRSIPLLLASLVLVSAPLYPAEELYEGQDLPPDDVIIDAVSNDRVGSILGKIAGDPCHEVYFWPLPGASVQKKTFC